MLRRWWLTARDQGVFSKSVIARSRAPCGDEAIQLDRRGALRAPRDDSHFENTPYPVSFPSVFCHPMDDKHPPLSFEEELILECCFPAR
jgi:hypothetical protein